MRKLPIYFVLDTSESMVGEPIKAVEQGLATMLAALRKDPYALETAYLSVITFGTATKQIVPLTELSQFQAPKLVLGSGTSLGAALELLEKRIAAEVTKSTADVKGDYKPLVFLMTDGEPTDRWEKQADKFLHNRHLTFVAIGCGRDVNLNTLRKITEIVILGDEANKETLDRFFKFISTSVQTASQSVEATGDTKISLDKLPLGNGITVVDANTPQHRIEPDRFIFLHCRCTKTKQFYLMKYIKSGNDFKIAGTFPLDEFDQTAGVNVQIAAEKLIDTAPCPYCGSSKVGKCSCGKTLCLPIDSSAPTTPSRPMRLMVTKPRWDDIAKILNKMKLSFSHFKEKIDCDIFFLNCGSADIDRIDSNQLRNFVQNGGILYSSDLAFGFVQATFPEIFVGTSEVGLGKKTAEVCENELRKIIGDEVSIHYDLATNIVVTIRKGDVILKSKRGPIMVCCPYGKGKIFYTTFHNHQQVSEKESALLQLLIMKQIGSYQQTSIKSVSRELNIDIKNFQNLFLQATDDYDDSAFCSSYSETTKIKISCPWCGKTSSYSGGIFSVGSGAG
ncbi:MAG: VWA domain-containing protein [Planctomycetaceae bacterium]|jgi:uncharacterized protein YegL|nr:VWA domain-containing protein [Planctomycetaceae bacterium]